jgi:hypothetical protein
MTKISSKPSESKAAKPVAKATKAKAAKPAKPAKAPAGPDKKPTYKVTNAYIKATITCLDEFDCDRIDKSLPDIHTSNF